MTGASETEAMERVKMAPAGRNDALAAAEAPRMRDEERRADMVMAVYCARWWWRSGRVRNGLCGRGFLSGRSSVPKAAFREVQLKT